MGRRSPASTGTPVVDTPGHTPLAIATLIADPARMARLRLAFGHERVEACSRAPELIAASRTTRVGLVVIPPRERTGRGLESTVAAINASRHSPPVYIYAALVEADVRELMPLARAGCRGLILQGTDDSPARLRSLADAGTLAWAIASIRHAAEHTVPTRYLPLVLHSLDHVLTPADAIAVARHMNVSTRTLSKWAAHAGVRGIRSLTSVCRVLVALEMLRHSPYSVEQVAHAVGFGSSAHLHNTIVRYTGMRPREAATRDAVAWCAHFFNRRDAPRPSPDGASCGKSRAARGMAPAT